MRKTDLRSRSFNAGSNGVPLFKMSNANASYYVESNEDEDNSEYEPVRRRSSVTSSSSSVTDSGDLSAARQASRHLLSAAVLEPLAYRKSSPQRRHSQQPLSSPRLLVPAPDFVITSASKIPETTVTRGRSPPSSSSYSPDDTPDFSIYSYDDEEERNELGCGASGQVRRKTIHVEHEPSSLHSRIDENELRWSSDATRRRRASQHEIEPGQYRWNNSKQDRYWEGQDSYYPSRDTDQASAHRRNTIVPPPTIVASTGAAQASPYRRLSAGAVGLLPVPEKGYFCETKDNLLSVPGCTSSSTSRSSVTVARSRSHSTPSSPEFLKLQADSQIPQDELLEPMDNYRKEKRRSLSPGRHPEREEAMQSPYYRQRSTGQLVDTRRPYCEDEDSFEDRMRKHSCADVRSGWVQRNPQVELRRISSSATCVVEESDTHRRRILPPTPDQLPDMQRRHINSASPRGYERTMRDTGGTSATSSLPSQQQAPSTTFYCAANIDDERLRHTDSNTMNSSSRQIASADVAAIHGEHRKRDEQLLQTQRASQFDEDAEDEEAVRHSMRKERRATAIGDSAMIPGFSASSNRCNSPRTGRGRKLPETPDTPNKGKPPVVTRMIPFSIGRQNTVGELLRQPPSPTATAARFHAPNRRVSEQIFTHPRTVMGLVGHSGFTKSPGSDNDVRATTAVPAWTVAAATSRKSPDNDGFQIPPLRVNSSVLSQFRQNSVSSSSSVPELITPNSSSGGAGAGTAADAATDSGHGSGAESAVGDGIAVSGSNSWPDAIGIGGLSLGALNAAGSIPTSTLSSTGADGLLTPSSSGLGLLHFTVQYFPVRKRLRVSVIKAERLAGQLRMDLELNTFVKVCLMPGKIQKQRGSRIVKRTRDATFNEEFFFDNITPEDLETKSIHLRLCHHVAKQFQKDVVIGQLEILLRDITTQLMGKHEVKLCQELKPKQLKKLGRLQISTCLENEARRLTINIYKVDDLPKFGISGPPDPCVRICVDQNGKTQTKQSRILKSTCNAVFKEAIMFLVSTKKEDLERTKIVISIVDTARSISGDDVVGNVYLGQLACDKTELDQWRNTLLHTGREFKATHQLKKEPIASADDDMGNIHED